MDDFLAWGLGSEFGVRLVGCTYTVMKTPYYAILSNKAVLFACLLLV